MTQDTTHCSPFLPVLGQVGDAGWMLTVSVALTRFFLPQRLNAATVAWVCFWAGIACCYGLVVMRLVDIGPESSWKMGFASFHVGLAAAVLALARGLQRGWLTALLANGFPVGLYWLAVWSLPRFIAQFH